jgi:hypothetical protein
MTGSGKHTVLSTLEKSRKAMDWLKINRHLYRDKWIALDGDQLIAVRENWFEAKEAATKAGVTYPAIVYSRIDILTAKESQQ